MIWLILLRLMLSQILLTADATAIVTLRGDMHPVDLVYQAHAGEEVEIIARSLESEPIDVTLEILQDNQRLAYNDDHRSSRPGLNAQDSVVENFVFSTAGEFTIRINSFNGAQSGDIEVIIKSFPTAIPCDLPMQAGELARNGRFSCTLSVESDSEITISLRDTSGTLDPVLTVLDERLRHAAYNDDHASLDFSLNTLDSKISDFSLSGGQLYTVQVTDFSGARGTFKLVFEIMP